MSCIVYFQLKWFECMQILGSLPSILDFYNQQFYNSQLIATICGKTSNESVQLRELRDILPILATNDDGDVADNPFGLCFVNVNGSNERLENRKSWSNQQEVEIVSIE